MHQDDLYRGMAQAYAETEGCRLMAEAEALGRTPTPGLDRKMRAALGRRRRPRRLVAIAALAACLAIIVAVGPLGRRTGQSGSDAPQVSMSAIPLGFDLPAQFEVLDVTVDRAQTVYTLSDTLEDPVVLTLERDAAPLDTTRLTAIPLGDATAYGLSTADYSLLALDRDGVRYVMTCRYDINTLLALGRAMDVSIF